MASDSESQVTKSIKTPLKNLDIVTNLSTGMVVGDRKRNCEAFNLTCPKCNKLKLHHLPQVCRSAKTIAAVEAEEVDAAEHAAMTGYLLAALESAPVPTTASDLTPLIQAVQHTGPAVTLPLPHHVHDVHDGWKRQAPVASPVHLVDVAVDKAAYAELRLSLPRYFKQLSWPGHSKSQRSFFDTGAQMVVDPLDLLTKLKVKVSTIFPIAAGLNTVMTVPVDLVGGILFRFTATNPRTGVTLVTKQLAYVWKTISTIYLSREACHDLGAIPSSFPEFGSCSPDANLNESCPVATHTHDEGIDISDQGEMNVAAKITVPN